MSGVGFALFELLRAFIEGWFTRWPTIMGAMIYTTVFVGILSLTVVVLGLFCAATGATWLHAMIFGFAFPSVGKAWLGARGDSANNNSGRGGRPSVVTDLHSRTTDDSDGGHHRNEFSAQDTHLVPMSRAEVWWVRIKFFLTGDPKLAKRYRAILR